MRVAVIMATGGKMFSPGADIKMDARPRRGRSTSPERIVGEGRTQELVDFADGIPAARAYEIGLCNEVVPGSEPNATATEWAVASFVERRAPQWKEY